MKNFIDLDTYIRDVTHLGNLVSDHISPNCRLVGVSRGGILPALSLSYRFNTHPIITPCHKTDSGFSFNPYSLFPLRHVSKCIIIDDFASTGMTLHALSEKIVSEFGCNVVSAVLYCKDGDIRHRPDFYVREIPNADIIFPVQWSLHDEGVFWTE